MDRWENDEDWDALMTAHTDEVQVVSPGLACLYSDDLTSAAQCSSTSKWLNPYLKDLDLQTWVVWVSSPEGSENITSIA